MPDIQMIRQQLRERFPAAHESRAAPPALSRRGLPDFPRGALTELAPTTTSPGLSLVLARLLEDEDQESEIRDQRSATPTSDLRFPASGPTTALIDATDSFDPSSFGTGSCARLLWVRCHNATESLRCADLLLRDGNLPQLILDLQLTPLPELHKIPPTSWYRLRNLAEQSGSALLVFTPRQILPCAARHLTTANQFSLHDLHQEALPMEWTSSTNTQ